MMTDGISIHIKQLLQLRKSAASINLYRKIKVNTARAGGFNSVLKGRGVDFEESRIYQPPDDIRSIDWRVTARTGKPHTKIFKEERERPVFIVGDFSTSMFFGTRVAFKSYIAAKIAGLLAWAAIENGDRIGGIFFDSHSHQELKPMTRKLGLYPLLNTIAKKAAIETANGQQLLFSDSLHRLRHVTKPGSLIVIISDFEQLNEDNAKHLAFLNKNAKVVAIKIYDILERELPKPDKYFVTNGNTIAIMDTANAKFCKNYLALRAEKENFIKNTLNKYAIDLIEISTQDNWLEKLQQYFGRKH
jgi:uncharacterized protein (DUF58 family)